MDDLPLFYCSVDQPIILDKAPSLDATADVR